MSGINLPKMSCCTLLFKQPTNMSRRIIAFNIIYYAVILILLGWLKYYDTNDSNFPFSPGYFIFGFGIASLITLIVLMGVNFINPKSNVDNIGIFTAMPFLSFFFILLGISWVSIPFILVFFFVFAFVQFQK
jgi:hypothetical protein